MIQKLCEKGIAEWLAMKPMDSLENYYISKEKRNENTMQLQEMMTQLKPYMNAFPKSKQAQRIWKQKGEAWFQDWIRQNGFFLMEHMDKKEYDLFFDITRNFLIDVRKFDETLSLEDCGQAMRNVWIIAILQRLFNKPIGYHKAMFAYSMLYPYSDNYLDDPSVSLDEKNTFNEWFTMRLQASDVKPRNHHEEKIAALIKMIEEVFDRSLYPDVYKSLLAIQDAQITSLHQQDGERKLPFDEILAISYYKGGASVVADGYLIDGTLSDDEVRFCMQYGFMLQLGDDLQDIQNDREAGHQTLASTDAEVDELFMRLVRYTETIFQPSSICQEVRLLNFVLKDCLFLLFLAVEDLHDICSQTICDAVRRCMPIDTELMKNMQTTYLSTLSETAIWERIDCFIA